MTRFIKNHSDVWLICERPNEARDNGYHLFHYIRKNHPNKKVFYLIEKNSDDLQKLNQLGNIIYFGSLKHYYYYFVAEKHISTHTPGKGCMPDLYACMLFELLFKRRPKKVYLQHGITQNAIKNISKEKAKLNLIVCGALPEYRFIRDNYGYSNNEVQYLGFARFDNLHDFRTRNQIMFMPTWRTWLSDISDEQFKTTQYFRIINDLLHSRQLLKILEKNDLTFVLRLHPRMQQISDCFSCSSKHIIIADSHVDIQDLLKESVLLITDYSSVFFDFAYMNKPIIYYQFDYSKFSTQHYEKGYFDYYKHGFGDVVKNETELISSIENMIASNFILQPRYLSRLKVFPIRDQHNCQRIYNAIDALN